jgi:non-specific serine/threonine protein kinase
MATDLLYGRDDDMDALLRLIGGDVAESGLLTIAGPPGVGKSRLARELRRRILDRRPRRTWMVELSTARGRGDLDAAVREALGLEVDGSRSRSRRVLVDSLADLSALLVLDDCDGVVEEAGALVSMLVEDCPGLLVLATSREPLGLLGMERVWRLRPLATPAPTDADRADADTLRAMADEPAVRLFFDRVLARQYQDGPVAPSKDDVLAAARMCRRLDGLPLLIELAAGRVGPLTVREVEAGLADRFNMLRRPRPGRPPQHASAEALLDWSYSRLTEPEQRLLRRLSVAVGGWTAGAVRLVCADAALPADETLALLAGLVDKSLVIAVPADGRTRYTMLETVRDYLRAKLTLDASRAELATRRDAYVLELVDGLSRELRGPRQQIALRGLEIELDNVRQVLEERPRGETAGQGTGVRLLARMQWYWYFKGENAEAVRWIESALAEDPPATAELAELLAGMSAILGTLGRYAEAKEYAQRAMDLARTLADDRLVALAALRCGMASADLDEPTAERHLRAAIDGFDRCGDRWGRAIARRFLGQWQLSRAACDAPLLAAAIRRLDEALAEAESLGEPHEQGVALRFRAQAALVAGDALTANRLLSEAVGHLRAIADVSCLTRAIGELGVAAAGLGHPARSVMLVSAADVLSNELGVQQVGGVLSATHARARELLEDPSFARERRRGQGLDLDQALAIVADQRDLPVGARMSPALNAARWPLTSLEWEYVRLVVAGKSNSEIAGIKMVSEKTVANKLSLIYRRVAISDRGGNRRAHLIMEALEQDVPLTDDASRHGRDR